MCLESKTKFFFEKHTESSDEGDLLDIAQDVSETKGNYDQNQLMLNIEKVLRDCEMEGEGEWGQAYLYVSSGKKCLIFQTANRVLSDKFLGSC